MIFEIDELLYFLGDEYGGVSVHCRKCDRGGVAIIYHSTNPDDIAYKDVSDVICVGLISELIEASKDHVTRHRSN